MAMLKKSRRNLQACTEVGLISHVLGMLENAGDVVAGMVNTVYTPSSLTAMFVLTVQTQIKLLLKE